MLRLAGTASTHVGQVRKTNQDRAIFTPLVGAVADGMGGHQGGEQAAAITIGVFEEVSEPLSRDRLVDTVRAANQAVFAESERPELRGMGTTIVAAVLHPEERRLTMVNVGDSRGYRLRDDELEKVTVDHSLVEELVRQGRISEEEATTHPQRNIVTRALGLSSEVEVDVFEFDVAHGDRFLLCSDGLSNEVPFDVIAEQLVDAADPELAAQNLLDLAVAHGGRDNISVVVFDVIDEGDPAAIRAVAETTQRPTPKAAASVLDTARIDEVVDEVVDASPGNTSRAEPEGPSPGSAPPSAAHLPSAEVARDRSRARLVAIAVIATFLVAFLGINWFASSAYFAAEDAGEVVIFKGRPGGVLWIDPEVELRTGLMVEDLTPAGVQKLEQEVEWTTFDEAAGYVEQLERVAVLELED
jgi:serine/threonine protein phosphatase PrpC